MVPPKRGCNDIKYIYEKTLQTKKYFLSQGFIGKARIKAMESGFGFYTLPEKERVKDSNNDIWCMGVIASSTKL